MSATTDLEKINEQSAITPEWVMPAHEEVNLATLDPDELGLDAFNEYDARLIDAIVAAKLRGAEIPVAVESEEVVALREQLEKTERALGQAVDEIAETKADRDKARADAYLAKKNKRRPTSKEDDAFFNKYILKKQEEEARAEWGEPLPLDDILRPVMPFQEEYLPMALRPWCKDTAELMGVPLDFTGIAALETVAGVLCRRAFVFPRALNKEWREAITLSGAVVASSGAIKTPTWKAFTNVIVEQEMDWRRDYMGKHAQWEKEHEKWEIDVKSANTANKNKKGGVDLIAGTTSTLISVEGEPQPPTPSRRLMLNDATPEKMQELMAENPTGLLYYRDELSSWVDELDKDGREGQRGMFLAAMNGDDAYSIDRIGRGSVFATMSLCVCGNFQPDLLRKFLSEDRNKADGTVARFTLLVWPDAHRKKGVDRSADKGAKETFRRVLRSLAAMQEESVWIHFDEEAQQIFNTWLDVIQDKIDMERDEAKRSHLSKYKGALPKTAALFQIVDMVSSGGKLSGHYRIDRAHTEMAISFFLYLESHMLRVYDSAYSPVQAAERLIANHILDGEVSDGLSARDIQRKWNVFKGVTVDTITMALENLADKHWVRGNWAQPGPTGGRPTIRWEVNPATRQ